MNRSNLLTKLMSTAQYCICTLWTIIHYLGLSNGVKLLADVSSVGVLGDGRARAPEHCMRLRALLCYGGSYHKGILSMEIECFVVCYEAAALSEN